MPDAASSPADACATVRVGRIEFVNCFPLYCHFDEELAGAGLRRRDRRGPRRRAQRLLAARRDRRRPALVDRVRPPRRPAGAAARHLDQLVRRRRLDPALHRSCRCAAGREHRPDREERHLDVPAQGALRRVGHRARPSAPARARSPRRSPTSAALLLIGDEALHILRAGVYPHSYDLGDEWRAGHRPAHGLRRVRRAPRVPGRRGRRGARRRGGAARLARPLRRGIPLEHGRRRGAALRLQRRPTSTTTSTSSSSASRPTTARGLRRVLPPRAGLGELERVPDYRRRADGRWCPEGRDVPAATPHLPPAHAPTTGSA